MRKLEIGGGHVAHIKSENKDVGEIIKSCRLSLPPCDEGYADAQLDDYGGLNRSAYRWSPGKKPIKLKLESRFSHASNRLMGTAGFGFWNAPFGDPTVPYPALPQAIWFFFGSKPNDLPVNLAGDAGQGFFANTLDATTWAALRMAPAAPLVLLLNRVPRFKRSVWPQVQNRLGISYRDLNHIDLTAWHRYELVWGATGSTFYIDQEKILETTHTPRGPLGFVCWIDNQYMQVTPTGRVRIGTVPLPNGQWIEIKNLSIENR